MTREARVGLSLLSLSAATDVAAIGALGFGFRAAGPWILATALHLVAVGAAVAVSGKSRSQRTLVAALTLTLPALGAVLAMVTLATNRRGEVAHIPTRDAPERRPLSLSGIRQITDGLSAWESLMGGSQTERIATVGMLARRADASSVELLRRAVLAGRADVAVDAAMALEDLGIERDRKPGAR